MWRLAGLTATGVAVLALGTALVCAVPPARAAAPLPGDLVALEQQTTQLQVNSERFSFQDEIALGGLGHGIPLALILAGTGEAGDSPAQASVVAGLFGIPEEQTRLIGDTVYRYRREAAEIDGGRPWVRSLHRPTEQHGLDPGGILESDQAGRQGTFSKLVEELNGALAVEEVGPVTVRDQRVIEFDAKLDPAPFLAQLKSQSKEPAHPLGTLIETSPVSGPKPPAKPSPPPTLELEVFIAPNGLPVRARVTFAAEGAQIALRVDTLAINVPVHVTPPPARETIDEAQLKRLERRRAAREREQILRACSHLHGKNVARCRRFARSRGQGQSPSSESSLL